MSYSTYVKSDMTIFPCYCGCDCLRRGSARYVQRHRGQAVPKVQSTLAKLAPCRTVALGGRRAKVGRGHVVDRRVRTPLVSPHSSERIHEDSILRWVEQQSDCASSPECPSCGQPMIPPGEISKPSWRDVMASADRLSWYGPLHRSAETVAPSHSPPL